MHLKSEWIERLQKRYDKNPTKKNEAALGNAKDRYDENIKEMQRDAKLNNFEEIEITSIDYKLIDKVSKHDPWSTDCTER